jgi:hypothetical protein
MRKRCYAHTLGDCEGTLSREHLFSSSTLEETVKILGSKKLPPREISRDSAVAKILCQKHNSMLSPYDSEAKRFIEALSFNFKSSVPQTLNEWVKRSEVDSGLREGVTSEERDRIKALERENKELRQSAKLSANTSNAASLPTTLPVPGAMTVDTTISWPIPAKAVASALHTTRGAWWKRPRT